MSSWQCLSLNWKVAYNWSAYLFAFCYYSHCCANVFRDTTSFEARGREREKTDAGMSCVTKGDANGYRLNVLHEVVIVSASATRPTLSFPVKVSLDDVVAIRHTKQETNGIVWNWIVQGLQWEPWRANGHEYIPTKHSLFALIAIKWWKIKKRGTQNRQILHKITITVTTLCSECAIIQ